MNRKKELENSINSYDISAPTFVISEELLDQNLVKIKTLADLADIEVVPALKASALWKTFPHIKKYFNALAASSLWEAKLCSDEFGAKTHTYAPAFNSRSFTEICDYSDHLIFNSLAQFERFYETAKSKGIKDFGLRVNPAYSDVKTDKYNPCIEGSRLGIYPSEMPKKLPSGINGLHFHALCESDSYSFERVFDSFEKHYSKYIDQIEWLNIGGGHLITHDEYDTKHFACIIKEFKKKYNIKLFLESGAALVWQTGWLVSHVEDIIESKGVKIAILDVSFAAHMPDCLEMPYQPEIIGAETTPHAHYYKYRMGGSSCLAGDWIGDWYFPKPLSIGDKIIFKDMIHYTMVKTTFFNGVEHPEIHMLKKDNTLYEMRKFDYKDYKNRVN
ncbi:MAG: carboxynorspermidine decarboxylase [Bacteroidales bacterium]